MKLYNAINNETPGVNGFKCDSTECSTQFQLDRQFNQFNHQTKY